MTIVVKHLDKTIETNGLEALGRSKVIRFLKFEKVAIDSSEIILVEDKLLVKSAPSNKQSNE